MANQNELYLGIDLGTTNSVAATVSTTSDKIYTPVSEIYRCTDLSPRRTKRERRALLPSNVAYCQQNDGSYVTYVGDFAKKLSLTQPFAVASSIKAQMGESHVSIPGWRPEYPDQTPEQVSARILEHIRNELSGQFFSDINEAVITIPACFNAAQRQATLKAAELGGLHTTEDMLLTEPEAVVYDVINQVQNGDINLQIDFDTPKNVLVFDIGGGTLDITLHTIARNMEQKDLFDIKPIAINRYCTIAGDTFDRALAERMFEMYCDDYRQEGQDFINRILANKERIMASLMHYAEELKQDISERIAEQRMLGRTIPQDTLFDWGGEMPNGYASDNVMALSEFESVLTPILGNEYVFEDYPRAAGIQDAGIITPVLDVLDKAAKKLGHGPNIDAVILNGGMSRLYLIEDRLERFFGFHPIKTNDPDKAVAKGAAVYHYYLKQNGMSSASHHSFMEQASDNTSVVQDKSFLPTRGIRSTGSVLNDTLYLGLRGGAVQVLAESGQDLPYTSTMLDGFYVPVHTDHIDIPIRQKNGSSEYKTIALGHVALPKRFSTDANTELSIRFTLSRNGILSFQAWNNGRCIGSTTVSVGSEERREKAKTSRAKQTLLPPAGSNLNAANELFILKNALNQLRNKRTYKAAVEQIRVSKQQIISCGNPTDFAKGLLDMMKRDNSPAVVQNCMPIARKLCVYWTESERKELSSLCLAYLNTELIGWGMGGLSINANIECIHTLGVAGTAADCEKLHPLCDNPKYYSALLQAFSLSGIQSVWIFERFMDDWESDRCVQDSMRALGLVLHNAETSAVPVDEAVDALLEMIATGYLGQNELQAAFATLAILSNRCSEETRVKVRNTFHSLVAWYDADTLTYCAKAEHIARTMLSDGSLEEEEEQYLLGLLRDL